MAVTTVSQMPGHPSPFESKPSFEAVLQHWAKARIDGPMQVIARFDDAAKQLIATGAVLQGLFFAVVALGKWRSEFPFPLWVIIVFFLPLLAYIFCAARVICTVPLQMEAMATYALLQRVGEPGGVDSGELGGAMQTWCKTIDRIALVKHRWLFAANVLFLASSATTLIMLLSLALM
jgi:hypothetical protein